jgi:hypothetical protein
LNVRIIASHKGILKSYTSVVIMCVAVLTIATTSTTTTTTTTTRQIAVEYGNEYWGGLYSFIVNMTTVLQYSIV